MVESSNNFESNLIDSLIALNGQSETLNEYIHSFRNEIETAISTDNVSITENLTPKSENLNLDELELISLNPIENKEQESPFSVNKNEPTQKQETNNSVSKENSISEDKIIEKVTANLEKTLSGLIKEEQDNKSEPSVEIKDKPPVNKVNDFFKKIAQEAKQQPLTSKQESNNSRETVNKDTESFLESLTPQELENLSSLDDSVTLTPNNTETTKTPVSIQKNNVQPKQDNNLLNSAEASVQKASPFANFTPNTFESTLESYFTQLQNDSQTLTPENIKFNDIQTLQQIISPQTFLNQNINKYNQTLLNTTNFQDLNSTEQNFLQTENNKRDNTLFYSFEPNNPLKQDKGQFDISSSTQEVKSTPFQQDSVSLENFTKDESSENIANYFDGIDPVLDEILQNTKLTNQALEGLIKILPSLMSSVGASNQQPSPPISMPSMTPSLGSNMGSNQNRSNMQMSESIPQIPAIRQQFLMAT
jgi:hypothetical protein